MRNCPLDPTFERWNATPPGTDSRTSVPSKIGGLLKISSSATERCRPLAHPCQSPVALSPCVEHSRIDFASVVTNSYHALEEIGVTNSVKALTDLLSACRSRRKGVSVDFVPSVSRDFAGH